MAFELDLDPTEIHALAEDFETATVEEILTWGYGRYGDKAAVGTSFQGAGLVILHKSKQLGLNIPSFTLDTGLLFPETYELKRRLEEFFDIEIEALLPEETVEEQAKSQGPELWKRAPDTCCVLRKVIPLQKKLEQISVWITGVRRQQSDTRKKTKVLELYKFDVLRDHYILKLNPLTTWSREQVWEYIHKHKIPYNPLHDQGYRSIGCAPCTLPAGEGDSERAGRWTGFDKSECGIHTFLGENI